MHVSTNLDDFGLQQCWVPFGNVFDVVEQIFEELLGWVVHLPSQLVHFADGLRAYEDCVIACRYFLNLPSRRFKQIVGFNHNFNAKLLVLVILKEKNRRTIRKFPHQFALFALQPFHSRSLHQENLWRTDNGWIEMSIILYTNRFALSILIYVNLIPHRRQLPNIDKSLSRLRLMTEKLLNEIHISSRMLSWVIGKCLGSEFVSQMTRLLQFHSKWDLSRPIASSTMMKNALSKIKLRFMFRRQINQEIYDDNYSESSIRQQQYRNVHK